MPNLRISKHPVLIGVVSAAMFVFLKNGPLFRLEWAYLFYGIAMLIIVVNIFVDKRTRLFVRSIHAIASYVLLVIVLIVCLEFTVNKNHVDIRMYLEDGVTSILRKYNSTENQSDASFLDPSGFVYYREVSSSDITKISELKNSEIWIDWEKSGYESKVQPWHTFEGSTMIDPPRKHQTFLNNTETLCSSKGGRSLCVNKVTREVLLIYL